MIAGILSQLPRVSLSLSENEEGGSRLPCIRKISRAIFLSDRVVRRASRAEYEIPEEGGWDRNGREEKCDTEGPVALSDARNSIKRVKSDVLRPESSESLARREEFLTTVS